MRSILILILCVATFSCEENNKAKFLKTGIYRAELKVSDNKVLPFNFEVKPNNIINIYNADEIIEVDQIEYKKRFSIY